MPWGFIVWFILLTSAAQGEGNYPAWTEETSRGDWTRITEEAVKDSGLADLVPQDIDRFCPGYPERKREDRVRFWTGLISALARAESGGRTEAVHVEALTDRRGRQVISRGLLQISIESANQSRYDCRIARDEDLHDPAVNLACAVKILRFWVRQDGVVAGRGQGPPRGGGRYWATLRETHPRFAETAAFTRNLAVCRPLP